MELWNATIDGLRVLRSWGVKYWDPGYLFRNNVFSSECLRRVVGEGVCGVCGGGSEVSGLFVGFLMFFFGDGVLMFLFCFRSCLVNHCAIT